LKRVFTGIESLLCRLFFFIPLKNPAFFFILFSGTMIIE